MLDNISNNIFEKYEEIFKKEKNLLTAADQNTKNKAVKYDKTILPEAIRSEVNFLIFPFFALWDKDIHRKNKIEFKKIIQRKDKKLEVLWKVSSNPEYGYPGPFDKAVHRAIEQTISQIKPPINNPIPLGSFYNLSQTIGLKGNPGWAYKQIEKAFDRILSTTIESAGTFYDKTGQKWLKDKFHLYERIILKGEKMQDGSIADENYLFLNSWYLENINARYVKPIDYNYYKSLKLPIASRLYELLGVKFYGLNGKSNKITYKYSTLCDLLPITRQRYLSKAKKILDPAHEKLKKTEFLADYEWEEISKSPKYNKKHNNWYLHYHPGRRVECEKALFKNQTKTEPLNPRAYIQNPKPSLNPNPNIDDKQNLMVDDILEVTGDEHSRTFYQKITRLVPEYIIRQALSETKMLANERRTENPARYFTYLIKKLASEQKIDL